jgi:hypothetical protein
MMNYKSILSIWEYPHVRQLKQTAKDIRAFYSRTNIHCLPILCRWLQPTDAKLAYQNNIKLGMLKLPANYSFFSYGW